MILKSKITLGKVLSQDEKIDLTKKVYLNLLNDFQECRVEQKDTFTINISRIPYNKGFRLEVLFGCFLRASFKCKVAIENSYININLNLYRFLFFLIPLAFILLGLLKVYSNKLLNYYYLLVIIFITIIILFNLYFLLKRIKKIINNAIY